ncbi:hypothetical protein LTR09_003578 [Extremus antarcticus]|uniref:Transcription regulator Rua1 C-terminal domain-containing protein n=1 Tax=Extremus antarcticus TaxID=702011 RepID=A0AAJ0GDB6_9PEZI|nr:hypothetical protein LTR09_003578 [Extremus antarcticus]
MNSSYGNYVEEGWIDPGWYGCDWTAVENPFNSLENEHPPSAPLSANWYSHSIPYAMESDEHQYQVLVEHDVSPVSTETTEVEATPATLFNTPLKPRTDPPFACNDQRIQQQRPRFDGDQYTALFVRGQGIDRAGWCGYCSSWHKMKDSAFWYHIHYSHGISCTTGHPFRPPNDVQWSDKSNGFKVQCPTCNEWMNAGSGDRARTSYFGHAYKCETKKAGGPSRSGRRRSSTRK